MSSRHGNQQTGNSSLHTMLMNFSQNSQDDLGLSMHPWTGWHAHVSPPRRCCTARAQQVSISTTNTDVVDLTTTSSQHLNISELCMVAFGVGKSFRFLIAHKIIRMLGPDWYALHCLSSMPSLGVILYPFLEGKAREPHGTSGLEAIEE